MPLAEFVKRSYPTGLGASFDVIEKLIAGNERAMLAWDKAVRGEHGGNRNPTGRNQHTPEPEVAADVVKRDNVTLDHPERQGGNSQQQGLRRLEKAAIAGDGNAADFLRRVVNPADAMTVNGACVAMGWRKPTVTVVDTPDGIADAAVRRIGPLDLVRQAWKRATAEQREEIAAWVDEQTSPLQRSAFR